MAEFEYGDIFLVDFDPSVGHEYQKIRPAIVVQSNQSLKNSSLVTIVAITSNPKHGIPIGKTGRNGLYKDSAAKVNCITSFDRIRLLKKIGIAEKGVMQEISKDLKLHLGL